MLGYEMTGVCIRFTQKEAVSHDTKNPNVSDARILQLKPFCQDFLAQESLASFTLLKQTHSAVGHKVSLEDRQISLFEKEGDYLITTQLGRAIAVETADCLPVVLVYSDKTTPKKALAVIHAGWRGSVALIVVRAAEMLMLDTRGAECSDFSQIQFFLGPSAGVCCYEVQPDFYDHLKPLNLNPVEYSAVMIKREGRWYFDNALLTVYLLRRLGIKETEYSRAYNFCTIHDKRFHSYRRNGVTAGRQLTIASLL